MKERAEAIVALAAYLVALLVFPLAHQRHHLLYGADHIHTAEGTIYFGATAAFEIADHHAVFDAALNGLGLAEVAAAGSLTVDCSLAAYTLADCNGNGDSNAAESHPHNFGDELLAREHHRSQVPPPFDPEHGRHSLEHLGSSLLCPRTFTLPPPLWYSVVLEPLLPLERHQARPLLAVRSRGPPSRQRS